MKALHKVLVAGDGREFSGWVVCDQDIVRVCVHVCMCVCLIEWICLLSTWSEFIHDVHWREWRLLKAALPWDCTCFIFYFSLCYKNTFSSEYLNDPLQKKNLHIKYSKCSSLLREYVRICIHQYWVICENSTFVSKSRTMSCLNDWFTLIKLIRKITNRHNSKENGVVTPHVPHI